MSHDNIQSHIKIYRNVFIALLIGTALTVIAYYVDFSSIFDLAWIGIFIGLLIAVIKGYLVAANFMHLNNEKRIIYWVLILSTSFLILLFFMPMLWDGNIVRSESTQLFDDLGQDSNMEEDHH